MRLAGDGPAVSGGRIESSACSRVRAGGNDAAGTTEPNGIPTESGGGMKALSIQQPWAWAILAGVKTVENRTWRTFHRGPLLIHASKKPWTGKADLLGHVPPGKLPIGVLLGTVEVLDCVPIGGDL